MKTHYPTYDLSFEDALRYDDAELLQHLLSRGLSPNSRAASGEFLLIEALRHNTYIARTLIEQGADVAVKARNGETAFQTAVLCFSVWCLEKFWSQPDVLTPTPQGEAPLHLAVKARKPETIDWLLKHGADPAAVNAAGETPLVFCRRLTAETQEAEEKAWLRDCERVLLRRAPIWDADAYARLQPELSAAGITAATPEAALSAAIGKADVALTEKLLRAGVDPNKPAEHGADSALFSVCSLCGGKALRLTLAKLLLQYGADPSVGDAYGCPPLIEAAAGGYDELVSLLLAAGANPHACDVDGRNVLYYAYDSCSRNVFDRLLELGVDATVYDGYSGNGPLSEAIWNNDAETVRILLAKGAHPFCIPHEFNYPDWAYAENEAKDAESDETPPAVVWRLLRETFPLAEPIGDREMLPCLFLNAVSYGLLGEVKYALSRGVSPDACNLAGKSALRIACEREDEQMVYTLLRYGANPNVEPSPLAAVQGKRPAQDRIARLLLGFGAVPAEVGLSEEYKNEALLAAARQGRAAAVRCLLAAGVSPNGGGGKNLPLAAASTPRVVALLVAAGADPNAHDPNRSLADTPLTSKAHRGKTACVEALLAAGADIEERDKQGMTPLLLAVAGGHLPCVRALLSAGADINSSDPFGNTPLMTAFSHRRLPVFRELLRAGADVTLRDCGGRSVADDVVSRQGWWSAWVEPYRALLAER